MTTHDTLNFLGLCLVTIGALGAIWCAPAPIYNKEGSVTLVPVKKSNESDDAFRLRRLRMYYYQKIGLPISFVFIAIGSGLQGYVAWVK